MKPVLGLLLLVGAITFSARAQSTMPAMGANTPKGEVAKTDASLNQASAASRGSASAKSTSTSVKRMHKTKTSKTRTTGTM